MGPFREFTGIWACSRSHLPDPTLYVRGKMCMPIKIPTHFQKKEQSKNDSFVWRQIRVSESSSVQPEVGKIFFSPLPCLYSQTLSLFYAFWLFFSPVPTLRDIEDLAMTVKEEATKWTKLVFCDHTGDRRVWKKETIDIFTSRRKESSDEAKCVREVGHEFLLRKRISLHDGLLASTHRILRSLSPLFHTSLPLGRSFEI